MKFTSAFLTCSSCSPSRSSILTSRFPHNTDAEQLHWPLPDDQVTVAEILRGAGYFTAAAGKWHLGDSAKTRFDVVNEASSEGFQLPADGKAGKMVDQKNASGCADWVRTIAERPKDKPFFMWLAALDPHREYQAGILAKPHRPEDVIVPPFLPDTPELREDLALYYDEITRLDYFVGQVIAELVREKVADNTVIIFLSDNGRPFPRCKTTVYDSGIKTPLIVTWPGKIPAGSTCDQLVSSIDLMPAVLDMAGINPPESFQGISMTPLIDHPETSIRSLIFAEHNWHDYDAHQRAVRNVRFKYIRNYDSLFLATPPADAVRSPSFQAMLKLNKEGKLPPEQQQCLIAPRPDEELYNLEDDPYEMHNLADAPDHAEQLDAFRNILGRWQKMTQDPVPGVRAPDEFDRETGEALSNRVRPRLDKAALVERLSEARRRAEERHSGR